MYAMPDRDHMGMLHLDADAECHGATDDGHSATDHGQRAQRDLDGPQTKWPQAHAEGKVRVLVQPKCRR
jgi:hypothetical protein